MSQENKPNLTARELSLLEAHAGILGRQQAHEMGGDPAQLVAMLNAAVNEPPSARETANIIGGLTLHRMCLGVSVALGALRAAYAQAQAKPSDSITTACMAAIFHDPVGSYDQLTGAGGLPAFMRRALGLVAHWSEHDITTFGAYVTSCQSRNPSLNPPQEDEPGKSVKVTKALVKTKARGSRAG